MAERLKVEFAVEAVAGGSVRDRHLWPRPQGGLGARERVEPGPDRGTRNSEDVMCDVSEMALLRQVPAIPYLLVLDAVSAAKRFSTIPYLGHLGTTG